MRLTFLMNQTLKTVLTGDQNSLLLRTKEVVVHAGHSQQLVPLKVTTPSSMDQFQSSQNNNWSIALAAMVTKAATVDGTIMLSTTFKLLVVLLHPQLIHMLDTDNPVDTLVQLQLNSVDITMSKNTVSLNLRHTSTKVQFQLLLKHLVQPSTIIKVVSLIQVVAQTSITLFLLLVTVIPTGSSETPGDLVGENQVTLESPLVQTDMEFVVFSQDPLHTLTFNEPITQ